MMIQVWTLAQPSLHEGPQLKVTHGPMAQWLRRLTTDQEIPGSNPGRIVLSNRFAPAFAEKQKGDVKDEESGVRTHASEEITALT